MDKNPIARIAVNKSVLPTHQNKDVKIIFMEGNTEFEIEIFNPLTKKIAVDIQVNEVDKDSPLLVVRPGERIWLDCGLKNKKKFLFETYDVENSKPALDAIKNNGDITIKIYVELEDDNNYFTWNLPNGIFISPPPLPINPFPPYQPYYGPNTHIYGCSNNTGNINFYQSDFTSEPKGGMSVNSLSADVNYSDNYSEREIKISADSLETGMVSEGRDSNTKFKNDNSEFDTSWSYIFKYKLLPVSTKNFYTSKDLKLTCQGCNRKQKKGEVFCPKCGRKF